MKKELNKGFTHLGKIFIATVPFIPCFLFGYAKQPVEMGVAAAIGGVISVFANVDKFKSFKAGTLEAEVKEVKEVIKEANATLDQLRNLAAALSEPILTSLIMQGRVLEYINLDHKVELKTSIVELLKEIGVEAQRIEKATEIFDSRIINDHSGKIYNAIKGNQLISQDIKDLFNVDKPTWYSDENALSKGIKKLSQYNIPTESNEYVSDLEYYLKERKLRRPNIF